MLCPATAALAGCETARAEAGDARRTFAVFTRLGSAEADDDDVDAALFLDGLAGACNGRSLTPPILITDLVRPTPDVANTLDGFVAPTKAGGSVESAKATDMPPTASPGVRS